MRTNKEITYDELLRRATVHNAKQIDIDTLGAWLSDNGGSYWNGESYDVSMPNEPSGSRELMPIYAGDMSAPEIIGYKFRNQLTKADLVIPTIPMLGLNEASEKTTTWSKHCGFCTVIRYDPGDGKVWASEISEDTYAGKYDIFRTAQHVSPLQIAEEIAEYLRIVRGIAAPKKNPVRSPKKKQHEPER